MRSPKRSLACLMTVAIGLFVLGSPPQASATFALYLQEDAGPITQVALAGSDFGSLTTAAPNIVFGDYALSLFSAFASDDAGGSNLLSSTTRIASTTAATHTLNLFVSQTDYTLPAGSTLSVQSGMGGTYGAESGFTGGATFRMWADSGNGLLTITGGPGILSNGLQAAIPPTGHGTTFNTGVDPSGIFTRIGLYSLTSRTSITTTGKGDVNYSNHVLVSAVPEPGTAGTLLLMGLGFVGMFIGVRRRMG